MILLLLLIKSGTWALLSSYSIKLQGTTLITEIVSVCDDDDDSVVNVGVAAATAD